MSKTHRRSRQRRGKLSRRMKKRGGGRLKSSSANNRIKFTLNTPEGPKEFIVDKLSDEQEQYKALDRFNHTFRNIQDYFINKLREEGQLGPGHNGRWMCVTAGDGNWHPSGPHTGSWEMLPKIVKWSDDTVIKDDKFVMSVLGEKAILGENRKGDPTFCVPEDYDLLINIASRIPSGSLSGVITNYAN